MLSLAHARRYLPHELITRLKTVELLRSGEHVSVIVRRYHVSRTSLCRWLGRIPHGPLTQAHFDLKLQDV